MRRDAKLCFASSEKGRVYSRETWTPESTPRVPEFIVASYSALLLAGLSAYGPKRGQVYRELPKWRRKAKPTIIESLRDLSEMSKLQSHRVALGWVWGRPLACGHGTHTQGGGWFMGREDLQKNKARARARASLGV